MTKLVFENKSMKSALGSCLTGFLCIPIKFEKKRFVKALKYGFFLKYFT